MEILKFKLFLLSFILCVSINLFCEELLYDKSIKPQQYIEILRTMDTKGFWINYDNETKSYIFYSSETMGPIAFECNESFINEMTNIIQKYKIWNRKASSNQIKLDKEMSTLKAGKSYWKWGDDWNEAYPIKVTFQFFSQSPQIHQFVMIFGKMQSKDNEYINHQPETLYFDYQEAIKLKNLFTQQRKEIFIKESENKKNIENEFK